MASSLILFVLFIIIYILISDIITIFFRLTGLTEEKARFQVISLLTNSGYTTRESESFVASKIRRRLARATMLFGYAFTVTIVSTTVNVFMSLNTSEEMHTLLFVLPLLICILIVFTFLRKSKFFKSRFDEWIERIGNRIMFGNNANPILLVEDYGNMVAAHIYIQRVPDILYKISLSDSVLREKYNIMVMLIKTKNGEAQQANANTILKKGDIIMVLGDRKNIHTVFETIQ